VTDVDQNLSDEQIGVRGPVLKQDLKQALNEEALASFQPLVVGIVLIYVAFTTVNLAFGVLPRYAHTSVLAMDVAMSIVAGGLWLCLARKKVPARLIHPVGAMTALLLVANVLATLVIMNVPSHAVYLVLVCVGTGCFMLSRAWLVAVIAMCGISWPVVALRSGASRP
jgi:hypothetical protein